MLRNLKWSYALACLMVASFSVSLQAVPPEFQVAPLGDEDTFLPYYVAVITTLGAEEVTVESPAGATYDGTVFAYNVTEAVGETFTVRLVASNGDGDTTLEYEVTVVEPSLNEFDTQEEFEAEFTDLMEDTPAARRGEVTALVDEDEGMLQIFLPGITGQSFDDWCNFDRAPRWTHSKKVFGAFALETRMEFLEPPTEDNGYFTGLFFNRGQFDRGVFGAISSGIRYERSCDLQGDQTAGVAFAGTWPIFDEDAFLRIETNGTNQKFFAKLEEGDPWSLVTEINGVRPPMNGVGLYAKNWGTTQGDYTSEFDYFIYEPLPTSTPTFTSAPTGDNIFAGTLTYHSGVQATGFPNPTLEVISPEGATIDGEGNITYPLPSNDPDPFTVTIRAANSEGSTDVSWDVNIAEPVFLDFDEQIEFDEEFVDSGNDLSGRKGEVTALVNGGLLELTLPDTGAESFDVWCGFDRAPRWHHVANVNGSFAVETAVNFVLPPDNLGANYHVGLILDRGFADLAILGPKSDGIELERACAADGEDSPNPFVGLFTGDLEATAWVRIEKDGNNVKYLGKVAEEDPWTTVFESNVPKAPVQGVGLGFKNWAGLSAFTAGFDYFDYGPLPTTEPVINGAPEEGYFFEGTNTYARKISADGFPTPELEVVSPEGASIDFNGVLRYTIPDPVPASFDITVRATNFAGSTDATWTVNRVPAFFTDFDTEEDFTDNFTLSPNVRSTRLEEVTTSVIGGLLEINLPDVGVENFDHWCNQDRSPRWNHNYQITDNYSVETAVSFTVPPTDLVNFYHVGLAIDRGTAQVAQLGLLRSGIEMEASCTTNGTPQNTNTFFPGLITDDPEAEVYLRIEAQGDQELYLARTDPGDPWTVITEVNDPRPLPDGVGVIVKNWGSQGPYTAGFDYFEYGPATTDPIQLAPTVAPNDEQAFKELPYIASVRASFADAVYALVDGPAGASIDEATGDVTYEAITEPVGAEINFTVEAVSGNGFFGSTASWTVTVINSIRHEFEDDFELEDNFTFDAGDGTAGSLADVDASTDGDRLRIFLPQSEPNFDQWCGFDRTPKWLHNLQAFSTFDLETRMQFDPLIFPIPVEGYHVGLIVKYGENDYSQFGVLRAGVRNGIQHERTCNAGEAPSDIGFPGIFPDDPDTFDYTEVTLRIEKRGINETYLARVDDELDFEVIAQRDQAKPNPVGVGIGMKNFGAHTELAVFFDYLLYGDTEGGPVGPVFKRGDVDGNGKLEITDPINNLAHQFLGTFTPPCMDAADFDDNGKVEITDPIANLSHQFLGTAAPQPPGKDTCGLDPTPDNNDSGELGCEAYPDTGCAAP